MDNKSQTGLEQHEVWANDHRIFIPFLFPGMVGYDNSKTDWRVKSNSACHWPVPDLK